MSENFFAKLGVDIDQSSFKAADAAMAGLKKGLIGIGAVVGAAKLAIVGAVKATADYTSQIHDLSHATGVSTETLQTLGYVGKLAGSSIEEMAQALVRLSRAAFEASTGGGEAGAAFSRLGIQAFDSGGDVRNINDLLVEVSAAIGKMQNPTEKTALALQLLGRGGARVTQALGRFGNDLEEAKKQARALGIVLDEHTIKAGDALGDSIDRINFAIKGLLYAIGAPLLGRTRAMVEGWVRWIEVNRAWLALKIDRAVLQLSQMMGDLVSVGKALMESPLRGWFIGLGVAIGAAMFPLTAFAAALALLAQDLYLFFKDPKADTLTRSLLDGLERLGEWFRERWLQFKEDPFASLRQWATVFIDWFADTMTGKLLAAMARVILSALIGGSPADVAGQFQGTPRTTGDDSPFMAFLRRAAQGAFGPPDFTPFLYGGPAAVADGTFGRGYGVLAPQFHAEFNFHGALSGDPQQAGAWRDALDDWWYSKVAEAQAATGR